MSQNEMIPEEKSPKKCVEEAVNYVKENLIECCKELISKSETGILKDGGCVRQVATILGFDGNEPYGRRTYYLRMAEDIIRYEAVLRVTLYEIKLKPDLSLSTERSKIRLVEKMIYQDIMADYEGNKS